MNLQFFKTITDIRFSMLKIAVTGSIASGKTTLINQFKKYPRFDADSVVSKLYKTKTIKKKLFKRFNTSNKKTIAKKAFSNKSDLMFLQKLFCPSAIKELKLFLSKNKDKTTISEIPLLFESNTEKLFDLIILISCSKPIQLKRLQKKGFSQKDSLNRINSQRSLKTHAPKADILINNSRSISSLKMKAKKIIDSLSVI